MLVARVRNRNAVISTSVMEIPITIAEIVIAMIEMADVIAMIAIASATVESVRSAKFNSLRTMY